MKKVLTKKIYGERLAEFREKANLTQEELGESIGYSRTTIVNWESKTTVKLDDEVLRKLASVLNVTSEDLTNVPRGANSVEKEDPVIEKYVNLINHQDRLIQRLQKELDDLRSGNKDKK